jgi:hypothetical protein
MSTQITGQAQGIIQKTSQKAGAPAAVSVGWQNELLKSDLFPRYAYMNLAGAMFGNGTTALTALSANTITLTATTTPILGVWNPLNSGVNLLVLRAMLASGINNAASTGPGAFVWAASTNNGAISTGSAPVNHFTLGTTGSQAKGLSFVALTGLSTNLVLLESSSFPTPTIITTVAVPTSVQTPTVPFVQELEGAFSVPPGGVLALLNTVSTTTVSVTGHLLWAELPA